MTHNSPIEIDPVSSSRERQTTPNTAPRNGTSKNTSDSTAGSAPTFPHETDGSQRYVNPDGGAYYVDATAEPPKRNSLLGSAASIVAGGALTLVGIPMLILPGPGLVAIGGGVALMVKGFRGFGQKN